MYGRVTDKVFANPKKSTDAAEGKSLFLANCASCHGADAKGGRGPSLVGGRELPGEDILRIVQEGIPGSTMPGFHGYPDEENNIVAYVISLQRQTNAEGSGSPGHSAHGNAALGMAVYNAQGCSGCHRIEESGSVLGPELTRIGASRSYDYLKQSLVDPSTDITPGSDAVTAVMADGRTIRGIRINEDTFTLQLRDSAQQFVSLQKSDLKSWKHDTASLMPRYDHLPAAELENLLAYMASLRGTVEANAAKSPKVIR